MDPRRLLVTLAVSASVAVPVSPASALPYCGGTWRDHAVCTFEAPAGAFAVRGTSTSDINDGDSVTVAVYVVIAGVRYDVGGCGNRSSSGEASCQNLTVDTPFDGMSHFCEVWGGDHTSHGTYLCADPPRLPLPLPR